MSKNKEKSSVKKSNLDASISVKVKVFPIAGLNDAAQELTIILSTGSFGELMKRLQQQLGADPREKGVMILHNGQSVEVNEGASIEDNDQIWVLPRLSGG